MGYSLAISLKCLPYDCSVRNKVSLERFSVETGCHRGFATGSVVEYAGARWRVERRWCTCGTELAMTPTPICYAMTRVRRTESGRPAASIWFRTATPMAASVCCAAKPRARNRGPISAL